MAFKGTRLSVGELIARATAEPDPDWAAVYGTGLPHDAADEATEVARMIARGESLNSGWRFGILQTLDDYNSAVRRGGTALGARIFEREPRRTGADELDAAFAALADHLASRDGWTAPAWASDPSRRTERWYPSQSPAFYAEANLRSPSAFRRRGVYISADALNRA